MITFLSYLECEFKNYREHVYFGRIILGGSLLEYCLCHGFIGDNKFLPLTFVFLLQLEDWGINRGIASEIRDVICFSGVSPDVKNNKRGMR